MAAGVGPYSVTFRDSKNQTASMRWFQLSTLTIAVQLSNSQAVLADVAALTNASVVLNQNTGAAAPVAGASADYENVEDKAVFVFQTAAGAIHRYQIPAPLASIFLADGETIDFTNGAVAAFVARMVNGNTVSRDGDPIASAVGGTRLRRKLQRKFNIRTRNPTLSGQGL